MRASELRLLRTFEQILAAVAALALPACHAASEGCAAEPVDASYLEPDAGDCVQYRKLPCGLPEDADVVACAPSLATCEAVCDGTQYSFCEVASTDCTADNGVKAGPVIIECSLCLGIAGRMPRGLVSRRRLQRRTAGGHFANMAYLEAAAVLAFDDVREGLVAFGAPHDLAVRAAEAEKDERRHEKAMATLSERFGERRVTPRRGARPSASLYEFLEDDAVEGGVRETFGALIAHYEATHAKDRRVARVMRRIAEDETRHAALSWDILAWGAPRLDASDRERLRDRVRGAVAMLAQAVETGGGIRKRRATGAPDHAALRHLADLLSPFLEAEIMRVS